MPKSTNLSNDLIKHVTSNSVFKLAVRSAFNHVIITDVNGIILYANSAAERLTGFTFEEMKGKTPALWGGQMPKELYDRMWHTIKVKKEPFSGELQNKRKNGDIYDAKTIISPILDNQNNLLGFIGTEEDITELKAVDRMKSEFISIAAHQLKTPLTGLRWNLELIEDQIKSAQPDDILDTLQSSQQLTHSLTTIVSDLLNISRIESGRMSVKPQNTNIKEWITEIVDGVSHMFRLKGQKVNVNVEDSLQLNLDQQLIGEVLRNLLSNASKYSPNDSEIIVGVTTEDDEIVFAVKDYGLGIPPSEKDRIFNKFFRSSNVSTQEGTGLGLYFVSLIVSLAHGRIWFESEQNKGTTFYFTIPSTGMTAEDGEVSIYTSNDM